MRSCRFVPVALATTLALVGAFPRAASADLGDTLAMRDRVKDFLTSVIEHGWNGVEVETEEETTAGGDNLEGMLGLPEAVVTFPDGSTLRLEPTKLYVFDEHGEIGIDAVLQPSFEISNPGGAGGVVVSASNLHLVAAITSDLDKVRSMSILGDRIRIQSALGYVSADYPALGFFRPIDSHGLDRLGLEFSASNVEILDFDASWLAVSPIHVDWAKVKLQAREVASETLFALMRQLDAASLAAVTATPQSALRIDIASGEIGVPSGEALFGLEGEASVDVTRSDKGIELRHVVRLRHRFSVDDPAASLEDMGLLTLDPETLAPVKGSAGIAARDLAELATQLEGLALLPQPVEALLTALEASAERPRAPDAEFDRYMVEIPGDGRLLVNGEDLMPLYRQHLSEAEAR